MTGDAGRQTDKASAVVIFGATGDLAKLETFPALVGLVDRGVLDAPVPGTAGTAAPEHRPPAQRPAPPKPTADRPTN